MLTLNRIEPIVRSMVDGLDVSIDSEAIAAAIAEALGDSLDTLAGAGAGGVLSVEDVTAADAAYVADSALGAAAVDAAHAEAISFGEGVVSRSIFARNDDTADTLYFSLDGGTSYGVLAPGEYISCDIARGSIKLYGSGEPQYLVIASYREVA